MLDNQFVSDTQPYPSRKFRERKNARAVFDEEAYDREFDYEGGSAGSVGAGCGTYQRGELQKSNTEGGHLPADFFVGPAGYQVIADFAVGSHQIKRSVWNDPNLKVWLNQILQIASQDPTAKIKISGYTDCINKENRNVRLREERAKQVFRLIHSLVGRDPRWNALKSRFTVSGAPVDQYIVDNATPVNRATNRGVALELSRSVSFDAEGVCDNRIKTVRLWLNAFIPRDIQGRTKPVPPLLVRSNPSMAGKTMFYTNFGCGLTDQRAFSNDPAASSRMHSEAKIDLDRPGIIDQTHRIEPSIELDCKWGAIICNKRSPIPPGMKYTWIGVSSDKELMVKVDGKQGPGCPSNPLIKKGGKILLDAQIDYHGTFFIKRTVKNGKPLKNYIDLSFLGTVDLFPAYEFVVQLNDAKPVHLGGVLPKPNSSPVTHLGTSRKVHFLVRLYLACKNGKQFADIAQRII